MLWSSVLDRGRAEGGDVGRRRVLTAEVDVRADEPGPVASVLRGEVRPAGADDLAAQMMRHLLK